MLAKRGMFASAHALVHPSVAGTADRDRHALFLAHMLTLSFAALGLAPLFLAFRGAPTLAESLVFAISLIPACAATLVARSGRLALGHLIASLAFTGTALVVAFGLRAGPGAAIAWLVAAQVEAAASLEPRISRVGLVAVGAALVAIIALGLAFVGAPALPEGIAALVAAPAALCATSALMRLTSVLATVRSAEAARSARTDAIEAVLDHVVLELDAGGAVRALVGPDSGFLGAPEHELLGRGLYDHVHVADRPAFFKLIDDAAQRGSAQVGCVRVRTWSDDKEMDASEPHFRSVEMRLHLVTPARSGGGCIVLLRDANTQTRCDLEAAAARRATEEALRAKDNFLTTMSHELRTPLNSIIGFSEILASRTMRPDDPGKQFEFARVIKTSGQHLLGSVNALLDMSRIQVGTYPIQPEPFDAVALLDHALDAVAASAREGSVELVRDFPARLEDVVGDKRALKQAFVALLSNAVKFTPAGGRVAFHARPEGNAMLVSVVDTGFGIPAADLARMGDPFAQVGGDIGRGFEGAGLGLALVRGLVGLHGGTLAIASEPGHGTSVIVRLPLDCRAIARRTPDAVIEIIPRHRSVRRLPSAMKDAA